MQLYNAGVGLRSEDIIGSKDLNKILSRHSEVEERFFKLWISSTDTLKRIFKSKIYNYSEFKKKEITQLGKFYVPNQSFPEAVAILKAHKYCIISGIPGIGKSTLTRILACHLLSKGFKELVYISKSFSDAIEYFDETKKQVFIFDDFLGKLVLEDKLEFNEDSVLLDFIEMVRGSSNTMLILATRENILNLAKIQYESLNDSKIELTKCIIDLGKYTQKVRALILSKHLYYSGMPQDYVDALLKDRFYFTLLRHRNYSPRIIESLTIKEGWKSVSAADVQQLFLKAFNNPYYVWKDPFERQLKPISRCLLLVMASIGEPVLEEDVSKALQKFLKSVGSNYDASYSHRKFDNAIKELHNIFITTKIDDKGKVGVNFQNLSVPDFLLYEIANDERIIHDLITTATYINQLSCVACYKLPCSKEGSPYISWNPDYKRYKKVAAAIVAHHHQLPNYKISWLSYSTNKKTWYIYPRYEINILSVLYNMVKEIGLDHSAGVQEVVVDRLQVLIDRLVEDTDQFVADTDLRTLSFLLEHYGQFIKMDEFTVMEIFEKHVLDFYTLKYFRHLEAALPNAYEGFKEDADRVEQAFSRIHASETTDSNKEYINEFTLDTLKEVGKDYNVDIKKLWLSMAGFIKDRKVDLSILSC